MKQFGWWCVGCITFYLDFVPGAICPCCGGYMRIRSLISVYNEQVQEVKAGGKSRTIKLGDSTE